MLFKTALNCDVREILPATKRASEFMRVETGLQKPRLAELELVLMEALNNAILHCEPEGRDKQVQLQIACFPDELELIVVDFTPGFDWPRSVSLPGESETRGRGLFLMESVMDEVGYYRGGHSNRLIAKRKLGPPSSDRAGKPGAEEGLSETLAATELTLDLMTEELSSCYESLSAIYCFSQELGKAAETRVFAGQVLGHLARIIDAEWFVCRLHSSGSGKLETLVENGRVPVTPRLSTTADAGVCSLEISAINTRQDQWFGHGEALSPEDPLSVLGSDQGGIVHPCHLYDTLVGVITVGKADADPSFNSGEVSMIHTLADFLMIHIINSRFQESRVENELLENELKIANRIQRSLYPDVLPSVCGCASIGWTRSARQVGGDYYDALDVGPDGMLLVVADVMGKGIPAAMFAAVLRSAIRTASEHWRQPGRLMTHVNNVLLKDLVRTEVFITAQVVFVDFAKRSIRFASAGHLPLLTAISGGGAPIRHSTNDMPLGVGGRVNFEEQEFAVEPGQRLAIYSDGIFDALNAAGERFGFEGLEGWIQDAADQQLEAAEMRRELIERLDLFAGDVPWSDDQTLLAMTAPESLLEDTAKDVAGTEQTDHTP